MGLPGLELREEVRARHPFGIIHQEMLVEGGKLKEYVDEEDSIKIRREQRDKVGEEEKTS